MGWNSDGWIDVASAELLAGLELQHSPQSSQIGNRPRAGSGVGELALLLSGGRVSIKSAAPPMDFPRGFPLPVPGLEALSI